MQRATDPRTVHSPAHRTRLRPSRVDSASVRSPLLVLLALFLAGSASAQKPAKDACRWCKHDPELMRASGTLSHGPLPIGTADSAAIVAKLPAAQWLFIETAHLRIAYSLGPATVDLGDKARIQAELARLRAVLPDVPKEPKKLDPALRLHLLAMKCEELHARFQKLLGVTDADFPAERDFNRPFMGIGAHLGERDKFELVIHSTIAAHQLFSKELAGVAPENALRYHIPTVHKLIASVPAEDPDLRDERWLFPHVAHLLSHMFLCAYKHFTYDPPLWLDEGLALCLEKEIEPASTTQEGEEGGLKVTHGPRDWHEGIRKLLAEGGEKRLAQLMTIHDVGQMGLAEKLTAWSIVRFLLDEHGPAFAQFLGRIKGQLDATGAPSGKDLPELQRRALKDIWDWTPVTLDEAWKAWLAKPR